MDFSSGILAIVSLVSTGLAALHVPLPEKFLWLLGFGLIALYSLACFLYSLGGIYMILLPALFWLKSVQETTGALALVIASYSTLNKQQISSHWYSLPTGCAPLAMISQYIPSQMIQVVLFSSFLLYCVFLKSQGKLDSTGMHTIVPAFLFVVGTVLVELKGKEVIFVYQAICCLACILYVRISTGTSFMKLKKKLI